MADTDLNAARFWKCGGAYSSHPFLHIFVCISEVLIDSIQVKVPANFSRTVESFLISVTTRLAKDRALQSTEFAISRAYPRMSSPSLEFHSRSTAQSVLGLGSVSIVDSRKVDCCFLNRPVQQGIHRASVGKFFESSKFPLLCFSIQSSIQVEEIVDSSPKRRALEMIIRLGIIVRSGYGHRVVGGSM